MSEPTPHQLPEKAAQTTPENPWPLRTLSRKIDEYVERMSPLWVEGQLIEITRRPGARWVWMTLRDADADVSMRVMAPSGVVDKVQPELQQGARVVMQAKPRFYVKNGSLSLFCRHIRLVGVGELLARVERLRQQLQAEGVFDPGRKRALPFLPRRIGLVCGRASAAEKDVVENARRRWPGAQFVIHNTPVQGPQAVTGVIAALEELQRTPEVDVIVVARGGGSFEDLLPFSNEAMIRAVSACPVPVVSAIGHDVDRPLLDLVADVRASTPTDASKLVVPDEAEERRGIALGRERLRGALGHRLRTERQGLEATRARPVLADPTVMVTRPRQQLDEVRARARASLQRRLHAQTENVTATRGHLRALSPLGTLERGYSVVRTADGHVVTNRSEVEPDQILRVTVADGDFASRVLGAPEPDSQKETA
ncbi:exodeoxyribonuclease VII large subunit [Kytococcus aerolatus]|nr:exodeoxyribonuclease VII large subunit [Kytococcus aerolatus]